MPVVRSSGITSLSRPVLRGMKQDPLLSQLPCICSCLFFPSRPGCWSLKSTDTIAGCYCNSKHMQKQIKAELLGSISTVTFVRSTMLALFPCLHCWCPCVSAFRAGQSKDLSWLASLLPSWWCFPLFIAKNWR